MSVRACALIVALVSLLVVDSAARAAPVEQVVQLARHPLDPDVAVLRYDFVGDGLFFTRDGGASWQMFCGSAIQPGLRNLGSIAMTSDGKTLFGIFGGVLGDDGKGCGWTAAPELEEKWITTVVNDPLDPTITYAVSSNGDPGSLNGIYRRDAATGAWTEQGTREELLIGSLLVVPTGTDTVRFYESVGRVQADAGVTEYFIRYSDDGGDNWTESYYGPADGSLRLEAADPTDSNSLVASISLGQGDDTVLISNDAGATFTEHLIIIQISGVAFAPDGRVWISDAGALGDSTDREGLWFAENLAATPSKILEVPVNCVDYDVGRGELFACGQRSFGRVNTATGEIEEQFNILRADTMLTCPGRDVRAECSRQLGGEGGDGFCAESHFPCAPVCADYHVELSDPTRCCDPDAGTCTTAPTGDAAVGAGSGGGGTGGAAGSAGTAGTAGAPTGGAPATTGGAPATGGAGGSAGTAGTTDDSGSGCSCSIRGSPRERQVPARLIALGLLAALSLRRRTRRRA